MKRVRRKRTSTIQDSDSDDYSNIDHEPINVDADEPGDNEETGANNEENDIESGDEEEDEDEESIEYTAVEIDNREKFLNVLKDKKSKQVRSTISRISAHTDIAISDCYSDSEIPQDSGRSSVLQGVCAHHKRRGYCRLLLHVMSVSISGRHSRLL